MVKATKKTSNNAFLPIVLVVLAVGGAGIYYAMQNKPKPIELAPGTALPTAEGHLRGDPNAPITIIEFADFECPGCGQFAALQGPDVKTRIVDAGLANFRFYDFPLTSIHQNTMAARKDASASRRICMGSRSRKMPDKVMTTSMRGRPSSAKGISCAPAKRP